VLQIANYKTQINHCVLPRTNFVFGLIYQESDFKLRLELIKMIANKIITDLKTRADSSYRDMNDWLGVRFQKEINSIQNLCNYVKFQIEHSKKIKKELILNQDDFIINAVSVTGQN
jgi:hypothetical protein